MGFDRRASSPGFLADTASQQRTELGIELLSPLTRIPVSFTSDTWTDNYKKHANCITERWIMSSYVLCTEEFNPSLKKTGVNIKYSVLASLSNFGIVYSLQTEAQTWFRLCQVMSIRTV